MRVCRVLAFSGEPLQVGNSVGNGATAGVLPTRTTYPGVYRRGSRYVAVYRVGGRRRKEFAATLARAIKLLRDAEAREARRGPTRCTHTRLSGLPSTLVVGAMRCASRRRYVFA